MKEYTPDHLRNVSLIGHGGAGKTSLAEAMLFSAGSTTRLGRVEEGNTLSDYHPDEIERQISINTSLLFCEWKGEQDQHPRHARVHGLHRRGEGRHCGSRIRRSCS